MLSVYDSAELTALTQSLPLDLGSTAIQQCADDDLVCHLSKLSVGDSKPLYSPMSYSTMIKSFPCRSKCWECYISAYKLDRNIVKNMYTSDEVYSTVNALLLKNQETEHVKMFTQLLSAAVFEIIEPLPSVVYRGVKAPNTAAFAAAYVLAKAAKKLVYWYNFASTSQDIEVAERFADGGWIFVITLLQGHRHCVASLQHISKYPEEREILIAANAGFRVDNVDEEKCVINLTLADESHCLKHRPNKGCKTHKEERA